VVLGGYVNAALPSRTGLRFPPLGHATSAKSEQENMANSDNEPNAYEATPVAASMRGIPLPTRGEWSSKGAAVQGGALRVTGVTTPMASLTQAAMQTEDLLEGYCKQVRKDVRTVLELLAIEPALMRVKWVRRAYERLMEWVSATRAAELLRQAIQAQPGMRLRYELGGDAVMRLTKVVTRDGEEQPYPAVPPSS
jgi:hypothetical protein